MLKIHYTKDQKLAQMPKICDGAWVQLSAPTEEELQLVQETLKIDNDLLRAALDEEERSRIDEEDGHLLILVDVPVVEAQGHNFVYSTIPFGIILTENNIVTVCLQECALSRFFNEGNAKNMNTKKKKRLTLQFLYRNAALFLFYLREVNKASERIENRLQDSMQNKQLIQMLGLEKSLVYFATSLKGNEITLERLLRMDFVKDFPDDKELLEDVIIENRQAMEMSAIYRDILDSTMNAFASVMSNNLNAVMKLLASLTIVLTIPTIVFSLWGANIPVPFQQSPFGFWILIGISSIITSVMILIMKKKKWL